MVRSPLLVIVTGDEASSAAASSDFPNVRARVTSSSHRPVRAVISGATRLRGDATATSRASDVAGARAGAGVVLARGAESRTRGALPTASERDIAGERLTPPPPPPGSPPSGPPPPAPPPPTA